MSLLTIYQLIIFLFLAGVLLNLLLNILIFPVLRPRKHEGRAPKVSVLIPARNEEHNLGPCLESLISQQYPNYEVLVLDDRSEDDTRKVALNLGFELADHARLRLLPGTDLPEGWTGKGWACHQLAQAASGEYLLFTDADTRHQPGMLATVVQAAEEQQIDLLSAWPAQITKTWSEKLVIPLIALLIVGLLPMFVLRLLQAFPKVAALIPNRAVGAFGAANGQFMFFRRQAYQDIGGHQAVASHLVEDVALGRLVASRTGSGMRLVNADGSALVRCRMYQNFAGVWEGFSKNLRAAFDDSTGLFVASLLFQFAVFLGPFVSLTVPSLFSGMVLGQLLIIFLLRVILVIRMKTSWLGALLHPVGYALALLIALNSWRLSSGKGVTWKGRRYRPRAVRGEET